MDGKVLQTELAMAFGRRVTMSAGLSAEEVQNAMNTEWTMQPILQEAAQKAAEDAVEDAQNAEGLVVLLTKACLHDPAILASVTNAALNKVPIIPICLVGRGYDFREASAYLAGELVA